MSKYTPWFSASVKPVRVGWYQLSGYFWDNRNNPRKPVMRYWNGRRWMWPSPFNGYEMTGSTVSPPDKWRGLAERAK